MLGPRVRITSEEASLLLTAPGADEQVTLQPTEEGATLGAVTELVLRGQAYDTVDEATQAAAHWRGLIQKEFARLNVPADFGDRTAGGGFFFRPALQMLEGQAGQRVLNDAHGTIIFECGPAPLFARLGGASYYKGVNVGRLQAGLTTARERHRLGADLALRLGSLLRRCGGGQPLRPRV